MKKLTFLLFISLVFSCNDNDSKKANDSIELFELMQGSFDSKNQELKSFENETSSRGEIYINI